MIFLRFWFIIICLSAFYTQSANGQLVLNSIEFKGLKKTKPEYLNRFLDTQIGKPINYKTLERDLQQLKNINAIADGNFSLDTIGNEINISFELKEALTLFPIINFGGVRGNFWYQLGFTDANWRGLGQQLTAFYQNNDGRNNFSIYYKIPYLNGSNFGVAGSLRKWASIEPLYFDDATVFYNYDNTSVGLSGFYQLKRKNLFEIGATYFVENYSKNSRHDNSITPGPEGLKQPKILTRLAHQFNAIDYHFFLLSGLENIAQFQTVNNFDDKSWFYIFLNDTRYFKRILNKGNLAARFRLGFATNRETPFAPFVLDSYINIRGSGNRIERGTAALILNLEYRQTIFETPKIGGQLVAFSDLGSWRNPGGSLDDLVNGNTTQHFVGGGFRLIYKLAFDAILRVDYGIDTQDFNRRGWVIGIGQYF